MQVDIAIRHTFHDPMTLARFAQSLKDLFAIASSAPVLDVEEAHQSDTVAFQSTTEDVTLPPPIADAQGSRRPRQSRKAAAPNPAHTPVHPEPAPMPEPAATHAPAAPIAPPAAPVAAAPASAPAGKLLADQLAAKFGEADALGATDDDFMQFLAKFGVGRLREIPAERQPEALADAEALVKRLRKS